MPKVGMEPIRRRQLIDATISSIGRYGYGEATVQRISRTAGVSSGIDMALTLVARMTHEEVAKAVQLGIEYDPEPPFDSGSTKTASQDTIDLVRATIAARDEAARAAG